MSSSCRRREQHARFDQRFARRFKVKTRQSLTHGHWQDIEAPGKTFRRAADVTAPAGPIKGAEGFRWLFRRQVALIRVVFLALFPDLEAR